MAFVHDGELDTPPDPSGYIDDFGVLPKSEIKQTTLVVYDDYVVSPGNVTVFSNSLLNGMLGAFDQMAIHVVTDRVSATGTANVALSAQIAHSGDGRQFVFKGAFPEVPQFNLNTTGTSPLAPGYDDGTIPSLAFVRIAFVLTSTAAFSAHFKCTVTCNNKNERAFTRKVQGYEFNGHCDSWLSGEQAITMIYHDDDDVEWGDHRIQAVYRGLGERMGSGFKQSSHRVQFTSALLGFFHCEHPPAGQSQCHFDGTIRLQPGLMICFRPGPSLLVLASNFRLTSDGHYDYEHFTRNPIKGDYRESHYTVVFDSNDFKWGSSDKLKHVGIYKPPI